MTEPKKPSTTELLKKKSNFMVIRWTYGLTIVLPYIEGIALLATLEYAESMDRTEYDTPKIVPIKGSSEPEVTLLSQEEYLVMKMRGMLLPIEGEDSSTT